MKTLVLIRHAKATLEQPGQPDFARTLTQQGIQQAKFIGQLLQEKNVKPDYIISSTAPRAVSTAQILANELGYLPDNIITNAEIYASDVEELSKIIQNFDHKFNVVFLIGHNPSLTWLAHYFCEKAQMSLPTCGTIGINFAKDTWAELDETEGELLMFLQPPSSLSNE